jgi:hypothetical protein
LRNTPFSSARLPSRALARSMCKTLAGDCISCADNLIRRGPVACPSRSSPLTRCFSGAAKCILTLAQTFRLHGCVRFVMLSRPRIVAAMICSFTVPAALSRHHYCGSSRSIVMRLSTASLVVDCRFKSFPPSRSSDRSRFDSLIIKNRCGYQMPSSDHKQRLF